jgi:UrcA family protein
MSKMLIAAAALALGALSSPALAMEEAPQSKAVSAVGVDFQNPASARAFYDNLTRAAVEVCDSHSFDPVVNQLDRHCAAQQVNWAVEKLNRSGLTAAHKDALSEQRFASRRNTRQLAGGR